MPRFWTTAALRANGWSRTRLAARVEVQVVIAGVGRVDLLVEGG